MATARQSLGSARVHTSRAGYTLVELMIVVAIVGILAAMGGPTFVGYVYKSRVSEATQFLGSIKLRQESYRAEFGQYWSDGDYTTPVYNPAATPGKDPVAFPVTAAWSALGASPDGFVRFSYMSVGGTPDTAPADVGLDTVPDLWFVGRAVGDLDGDGTKMNVEVYSNSKNVWIGKADGTDLAQGWE